MPDLAQFIIFMGYIQSRMQNSSRGFGGSILGNTIKIATEVMLIVSTLFYFNLYQDFIVAVTWFYEHYKVNREIGYFTYSFDFSFV